MSTETATVENEIETPISREQARVDAATERLEAQRSKFRDAENIGRRLAGEQLEIAQKLRGMIFLMSTDEVAWLLLQRMAIELQLSSLKTERPYLENQVKQLEIELSNARQCLE